jgi:hypothetical protein
MAKKIIMLAFLLSALNFSGGCANCGSNETKDGSWPNERCVSNTEQGSQTTPTPTPTPTTKVFSFSGGSAAAMNAVPEVWDSSTGLWTSAGEPPNGPMAVPDLAVLSTGNLLLIGGGSTTGATGGTATWGDNNTVRNLAAIFDVNSNAWSATGSLVNDRNQSGWARLQDGNILVFGGCAGGCSGPSFRNQFSYGGATTARSTELYDVTAGTWTLKAQMNSIHGNSPRGVTLQNGKVLACGGNNGGADSAACELYDPSLNTWTNTGAMAGGVQFRGPLSMILLQNGKVIAGHHAAGVFGRTQVYDPSAGTWSNTSNYPAGPRAVGTMTLLPNGKVAYFGGIDSAAACTTVSNLIDIYDPTTDSWSAGGTMTGPRYHAGASVLKDGKVLVSGGCATCNCAASLTSAEIYDPSDGTTTATGSMATGRHQLFQISLP